MNNRRNPLKLAKYVAYVLERRPDEFGLVPDPEGFIKIKEFLKALREEPDCKPVRRGDLEEVRLTVPNPPLEITGGCIRGRDRQRLPPRTTPAHLPKLLFTCVRRRAYPHVHDKGLRPMGRDHVVLATDRDMALRLGRRMDTEPVMLTVMTRAALQQSVSFEQAGAALFLARFIPADCFSGPPVPKEPEPPPKAKPLPAVPTMAGSFTMNPDHFSRAISGGRKNDPAHPGGKDPRGSNAKKRKRKRERPPWRQ